MSDTNLFNISLPILWTLGSCRLPVKEALLNSAQYRAVPVLQHILLKNMSICSISIFKTNSVSFLPECHNSFLCSPLVSTMKITVISHTPAASNSWESPYTNNPRGCLGFSPPPNLLFALAEQCLNFRSNRQLALLNSHL